MQNLFSKVLEKVRGDVGERFEITCAADWNNVPSGFFKTAKGLGYKSHHNGIMLPVGETVVDGAQRVTLDPKLKLPEVILNYVSAAGPGVQRIGGSTVLDTDALDGDQNGAVRYEGDCVLGKLKDEQIDKLEFGLWGR